MRCPIVFIFAACSACMLAAQQPSSRAAAPLPDIQSLMVRVQAHQRQLDKVRENYTYKETIETDDVDSDGKVKKTEVEEFEVFFVNSHHIHRLVAKNGKPLSADEQKKEQERIAKEIDKATKLEPGKSLNAEQLSVSRVLSIMKVSNPRRVVLNGRETIAFDFVGDPHAQTHGIAEDASKKMAGTLWVDEKDTEVSRLTVQLDDNFRIGGGLVASLQKGSSFEFEQALVNNELWLPTSGAAHVQARVLLLKGYRQNMRFHDSNYQRFHADATQSEAVPAHTP